MCVNENLFYGGCSGLAFIERHASGESLLYTPECVQREGMTCRVMVRDWLQSLPMILIHSNEQRLISNGCVMRLRYAVWVNVPGSVCISNC